MTAISEIGIQSVGHKLCQSVVSRGGLREFSESDGGSRECKRGFLYSYLRSRLRERVPSTTQHLSMAVLVCHLSLHSTDCHPPWKIVDARAWGNTRTTLKSEVATALTGRKQGDGVLREVDEFLNKDSNARWHTHRRNNCASVFASTATQGALRWDLVNPFQAASLSLRDWRRLFEQR